MTATSQMPLAEAAATLPRILAGMPANGPMSFARHEAIHGVLPAPTRGRHEGGLISELASAGLRGRGGASFPTAIKLDAVAGSRGRPVVVANGCEGEPTSHKDRLLLEHLPHLVIDGALLAARAVRAREIVFAVEDHRSRAIRAMEAAVAERHDLGRTAPRLAVTAVPAGYISGQETALVNFLGNGLALPTSTPPPVYQRGVGGHPTLVDNVETLAHLALIARHGAGWFRSLGSNDEPGSRLITVSGAVAYPGVFEIESGAPLRSLLEAAGGATEPIRAFLLGGYAGAFVGAEQGLQLTLSDTRLRSIGATLGAGILVVLPASACPVAEVANVAHWMSDQAAGQCGPCINGLAAIADTLCDVQHGAGGDAPMQRLTRWISLVRGRGACAHPDGVAQLIASALDVFSSEFADHATHGVCEACVHRRILPGSVATQERRAA